MLNFDRSLKPLIGLAVIALVLAAFAMACQGEEEPPGAATCCDSDAGSPRPDRRAGSTCCDSNACSPRARYGG